MPKEKKQKQQQQKNLHLICTKQILAALKIPPPITHFEMVHP